MTALLALLALFAAVTPIRATETIGNVAQRDSLRDRAELDLAIAHFQREWQRAWMTSEEMRTAPADTRPSKARGPVIQFRAPFFHCHPEAAELLANLKRRMEKTRRADTSVAYWGIQSVGAMKAVGGGVAGGSDVYAVRDSSFAFIPSEESAFAACPSWMLSSKIFQAQDERAWRDGALVASQRPVVEQARARLLATLDSAAVTRPNDEWLAGQRVRFHIDQKEFQKAREVAAACSSESWWCGALMGYVQARQGVVVNAESTFKAMYSLMPEAKRCEWSDVSTLLSRDEQKQYRAMNCSERAALLEKLWWLSDPLFRTPGNDRYVEQEQRRVEVMLRQATLQDERYSWDLERGGDALVQLVTRFGWPSYTGWAGIAQDDSHSQYLRGNRSTPTAPYTTFEYTQGRVHALPALDAAMIPADAVSNDWRLSVDAPDGSPSSKWWPIEHFQPSQRLVQMDEGQTAFFRRQSHIAVATALRLQHPTLVADSLLDVMMLVSSKPGQFQSVDQRVAKGGSTLVLQGLIDTLPAVLSVEALSASEILVDARTRFGIRPPQTLAAMKPGEVALSTPVLLDMTNGDASAEPNADLVERMLPTANLDASMRSVGVYWESYGINPGDTVTISAQVARDASVGRLRRIGIAVNLVSDPNSSVTIKWVEPNAQRSVRTLVGPVTVQMRLLTVNMKTLPPGNYLLEVGMQKKNGVLVKSQRRLTLLP